MVIFELLIKKPKSMNRGASVFMVSNVFVEAFQRNAPAKRVY